MDQPVNYNTLTTGSRTIRVIAHLVSYVFHPLFIPTYVVSYLIYLNPYSFAELDERMKFFKLLSVFFSTFFLPAFSVFLMRRLGLIKSIFLNTQRERIIPYAASIVFYFWAWYVSNNQNENPLVYTTFLLGTFLAVCGAWFFNISGKISMHAVAMGGLATFFLLTVFITENPEVFFIAMAIFIAGLVCSARLTVSDHTTKEIYGGIILGAFSQLVGWWLQ